MTLSLLPEEPWKSRGKTTKTKICMFGTSLLLYDTGTVKVATRNTLR